MTWICIALIALCDPVARRGVQQGLVAPARAATLSTGSHSATPKGQVDFGPWTALLVDHDAIASLSPRASPQTKIDSVRAVQIHVIGLYWAVRG